MRISLTDMTLRNLKAPEKGQRTYLDKNLHGFGVRVSQGGTKTFTLMHGPNRQLTTIGRVGIVSLATAREKARNILAEEQLGVRRIQAPAFDAAVEQFIAKPRTVPQRQGRRPVCSASTSSLPCAISRSTKFRANESWSSSTTFLKVHPRLLAMPSLPCERFSDGASSAG